MNPHPPPAPPGPRSPVAPLVTTYLAFAALFVLLSCAMAAAFRYDVLLRDQWPIYGTYLTQPFWDSVWAPRNGHRIFFPGLLFRADLALFSGGTGCLVVLQYGMNLALTVILAREVWRGGPEPVRRVVAGFLFVLNFWMGKNLDLTLALGVVTHLTALGSVLGLMAVLNAADAARAGRARAAWLWVGGAASSAAVATLSYSNGFIVWPVLCVVGWLARLPRRLQAVLLGVGAVAVALFLAGNPGASGMAWHRATFPDFLRLAVTFLGAPVAHALDLIVSVRTPPTVTVAFVAGLLALAATAACVLRLAPRLWRGPPRDVSMAAGLLLFVGGSALAVAYGRVEQMGPAAGASQRYVSWGVLYWGALAMLLPALARPAPAGQRFQAAAAMALALVSVALVPSHLRWGFASARTNLRAVEAALALVVGVRDDARVRAVLSVGDRVPQVYRVAGELKARRLNFFGRPFAALPGEPVPAGTHFVGPGACRGAVTAMGPAPGGPGLRVDGWAWDEAARRPPRLVLLLDRTGTVQGLGRFTRAEDAAPPLPEPGWVRQAARIDRDLPAALGRATGWRGYARSGARLAAFAVLADGRALCPLPAALAPSGSAPRSVPPG